MQQERNEYQSRRSEQDVIFLDATHKKQQKIVALNTMLDEKQLLADRLEKDLNEQGKKIAQHEETQEKLVEMESLVTQSSSELDAIKKQLKTELDTKNEEIEQAAKIHKDKVSELEQILQDKQTSDITADPSVNVEKTIQQPGLQTAILIETSREQEIDIESSEQKVKDTNTEKQDTNQVLDWFSSMDEALEINKDNTNSTQKIETEIKPIIEESPISSKTPIDDTDLKSQLEKTSDTNKEEKTIQQELINQQSEENSQTQDSQTDIPNKESQIQDKNVETLEQKVALDKGSNIKNPGVVGQVLGWFSSMDKSLDINEGIEDTLESAKKVNIKKKPSTKEIPDSVTTALDDEDSSFSEKLAEAADSMDSFTDKVKNIYHKVTK